MSDSSGTWIREFNGDGVFRDEYGRIWMLTDDSKKMQGIAWEIGRTAGIRAAQGFIPVNFDEFHSDNPYRNT